MEAHRALAKLTLSLRIAGRRSDGYHLLSSEMVTLDLADRLVFDEAGDGLEVVGPFGDVPSGSDNLVARALLAVERRAFVRLEKAIRPGAGLGGGSADAAAVLRWAGCDDPVVAATLGADVPFCLSGGRALVSGVGDIVQPLPLEEGIAYTLLTPPFGVSTAAVYRAWDDLGGPTGDGPNDLEPAAVSVEPRLRLWRDRLGNATGLAPCLAGSGSTWFVAGAFEVDGALVVHTASS